MIIIAVAQGLLSLHNPVARAARALAGRPDVRPCYGPLFPARAKPSPPSPPSRARNKGTVTWAQRDATLCERGDRPNLSRARRDILV